MVAAAFAVAPDLKLQLRRHARLETPCPLERQLPSCDELTAGAELRAIWPHIPEVSLQVQLVGWSSDSGSHPLASYSDVLMPHLGGDDPEVALAGQMEAGSWESAARTGGTATTA